jgi:hypothetical protein
MTRWMGCIAALVSAVVLLIAAVANHDRPLAAVGLLTISLIAWFFALWQYNQARLPPAR